MPDQLHLKREDPGWLPIHPRTLNSHPFMEFGFLLGWVTHYKATIGSQANMIFGVSSSPRWRLGPFVGRYGVNGWPQPSMIFGAGSSPYMVVGSPLLRHDFWVGSAASNHWQRAWSADGKLLESVGEEPMES